MKVYQKPLKHMKIGEVLGSLYNFAGSVFYMYHHAYTTDTYSFSHFCSFDWERSIKEKSLREGLKKFGCASDQ